MDRCGAPYIPRRSAAVVSPHFCSYRMIPFIASSAKHPLSSSRQLLFFSGRGKWKEIATMIPTRSTVQVKTHAQMVMKRVAAGDEAFAEYYLDLLASPSLQIGEMTTMLVKEKESFHSKSGTTRRNKVIVSEIYDEHGLSQKDQQAAHILYQMAH